MSQKYEFLPTVYWWRETLTQAKANVKAAAADRLAQSDDKWWARLSGGRENPSRISDTRDTNTRQDQVGGVPTIMPLANKGFMVLKMNHECGGKILRIFNFPSKRSSNEIVNFSSKSQSHTVDLFLWHIFVTIFWRQKYCLVENGTCYCFIAYRKV